MSGLESIETSDAPEDFRVLFEEYVTLFQRGLADFNETGVIGRYDAQINAVAQRIKAY